MKTKYPHALLFALFLSSCAAARTAATVVHMNAPAMTDEDLAFLSTLPPEGPATAAVRAKNTAQPNSAEFVLRRFNADWVLYPDAEGRAGFLLACATRPGCDARETPEACTIPQACESVQYNRSAEAGRPQLAVFYSGSIVKLFRQQWRIGLQGRYLCLETGRIDTRQCERIEVLQTSGYDGVVMIHSRLGAPRAKFAQR